MTESLDAGLIYKEQDKSLVFSTSNCKETMDELVLHDACRTTGQRSNGTYGVADADEEVII